MKKMLISIFVAFLMNKGCKYVGQFWKEWYKEFPYRKRNVAPLILFALASISADVIAVINVFRFLFSL